MAASLTQRARRRGPLSFSGSNSLGDHRSSVPGPLHARADTAWRSRRVPRRFCLQEQGGELVVEDAKGMRTKDYVIKRKLMLSVHGIRVSEV